MRKEKQLLLDEVRDQLEGSDSFVIMKYQSLPAVTVTRFRNEIAKMGGHVEVMRKRILVKAAEAVGITLDVDQLPGHIGIVFAGRDPIETTKIVFKFSQETDKAISVVGGRFEKQLYSAEDVEQLSKLPGKDEMRAQLLSVFEAPMSQTLAVMDALLTSVIHCLENKCQLEETPQQENVEV